MYFGTLIWKGLVWYCIVALSALFLEITIVVTSTIVY